MGIKLNKIYTKRGDSGKTSLWDGTEIDKSSDQILLLGELDMLNHTIGGLRLFLKNDGAEKFINTIQNNMFKIMGDFAYSPEKSTFSTFSYENGCKTLEDFLNLIYAENSDYKQDHWALYGEDGYQVWALDGASIHVRKVEVLINRYLSNINHIDKTYIQKYFNMLSKVFYILARINYEKHS